MSQVDEQSKGPSKSSTGHSNDRKTLAESSQELRDAAMAGNYEKVKQLCDRGVPIDADMDGRTALHFAAAIGHIQIVKLLIQSGANINSVDHTGYSSLHYSAMDGHVEVIKLFLRHSAASDVQNFPYGNTALHEAAWKGYSKAIQILCKFRCNLHLKNKSGNTALHVACQQGHNQSCRNLLIHGSKPNSKNNFGDTPLHTAARYGHAGVLRILISAFCNVNEINENGDTSLHISAAMGRRKLTKILLESGCDRIIKNKQNETAMDIAVRKGLKEIEEILVEVQTIERPVVNFKENGAIKKTTSSHESGKSEKQRQKVTRKSKRKSLHKVLHESPYGCPLAPDAKELVKADVQSLPAEPLKNGEKYFVDLAGNIRKGPIGKTTCNCGPLFKKVERTIESNKKELKEHIENCRENLKEKICSLEKETNHQFVSLAENLKSKLTTERLQCIERAQKCNLKQRMDFERSQSQQVEQLKDQMKNWLETRLNTSSKTLADTSDGLRVGEKHLSTQNSQPSSNPHYLKSSGVTTIDDAQIVVHPPKNSQSHHYVVNDRPKSCLSYQREQNSVDQRLMMPYLSKSEVHLARSNTECFRIPQTPELGLFAPGSDERIVRAEVYHYQGDSCSEDSDIDDEHPKEKSEITPKKNLTTCQSNESEPLNNNFKNDPLLNASQLDNINDLMKSLRCNSAANNECDFRNSPFSDSGFRSKYSPSPRDCPISDGVLYRSNVVPSDPPIGLPLPHPATLTARSALQKENISAKKIIASSLYNNSQNNIYSLKMS